jgi:hypothetical protein
MLSRGVLISAKITVFLMAFTARWSWKISLKFPNPMKLGSVYPFHLVRLNQNPLRNG